MSIWAATPGPCRKWTSWRRCRWTSTRPSKACEVECKAWNQLPGNEPTFGDGFDNTGSLDSQNWRHVKFIDNVPDTASTAGQGKAWLMMSDVCKHCQHASCMEVCPTGAIIKTQFDTVYIQPD